MAFKISLPTFYPRRCKSPGWYLCVCVSADGGKPIR